MNDDILIDFVDRDWRSGIAVGPLAEIIWAVEKALRATGEFDDNLFLVIGAIHAGSLRLWLRAAKTEAKEAPIATSITIYEKLIAPAAGALIGALLASGHAQLASPEEPSTPPKISMELRGACGALVKAIRQADGGTVLLVAPQCPAISLSGMSQSQTKSAASAGKHYQGTGTLSGLWEENAAMGAETSVDFSTYSATGGPAGWRVKALWKGAGPPPRVRDSTQRFSIRGRLLSARDVRRYPEYLELFEERDAYGAPYYAPKDLLLVDSAEPLPN